MRSSKSRSRSKSNRSRSVGNIVNRVFDSSGPEGKVRGTPQQIIDKYNQLARDAQLGGDRVATENFQQHAEHYTRMLAEAQREQEARREQHEQQQQQQRERQQQQHEQRGDDNRPPPPEQQPQPEIVEGGATEVIDMGGQGDSGLVETPESRPAKPPRRSRSRKSDPKPEAAPAPEATADTPPSGESPDAAAAAE